jgi:hypothetical protein
MHNDAWFGTLNYNANQSSKEKLPCYIFWLHEEAVEGHEPLGCNQSQTNQKPCQIVEKL